MRKFVLCFTLMIVTGFNAVALAQDEAKAAAPAQAETKGPDIEMAIEMTKTIMVKMFEKAELSDEQNEKITSILDGNVEKLVRTRQSFQEVLTADERRLYNNAKKQARRAKYDDKKAEAYAMKKLNLTEERMKKYNTLKDEVQTHNKKINDAIAAILTDEQKAKLPMFKQAAPKKEGSDSKGSAAKEPAEAGK